MGSDDEMMTPPAAARRLVRWALGPGDDTDVVLGELDELFRLRAAERGRGAARRWYWRQALGFTWRAPAARLSAGRNAMFGDLGSDIRWSLRMLRKQPTFAVVAVLTLALGIGANSAIFTLVGAHFFEALPWQEPDDLVLLWETERNSLDETTVAPGNYFSWREQAGSFQDVAAFNVDFATLSGDGVGAERVNSSEVVPHFFDVLGVEPALGSGFDEQRVRDADGRLVMLGHGLWTRRYGADPGIVGTDIRVDGRPHTVVGVLPEDYRQPERSLSWQTTELWRPVLLEDEREAYGSRYLRTVARLRPGVSVEGASEEMTALAARMAEAYPEQNGGRTVLVRTLDDYLMGEARPTLLMLLVAGAAVFLIVCANVANLTLARGEERRREFALRAALGSGRSRLLRQLLVEGVVLALIGAVVGTLAVYAGRDLLQIVQARFFTGLVDATLDLRVILFTTVAALGAGILFGLPLARTASTDDLRGALVEGGERSGSARDGGGTRNLLIVGQVGLATALVVVAALLTRSFNALVDVPPGFQPNGVLTFGLQAPTEREGREGVVGYYREVWDELESVPGVDGVGMVSDMPFTLWNMWTEVVPTDRATDPTDPLRAEFRSVTPEYFEVMGIPLERGAFPQGRWEARSPVPVIVNRTMAELYWPERNAVGASFRVSGDTTAVEVVGVVGDVLDDGYDARPEPIFYQPFGSRPRRGMDFVVAVVGNPSEVIPAVRRAVAAVDPDVPVADLAMVEDLLAETVVRPRAASLIGGVFAVLALLVAAAGIYGVLSYLVHSRTREIGVRSALGASRSQIMGLVLRRSTQLLIVGLLVGVGGGLVAGRALSGLLFGVPAWDPVSMAAAVALLGGVGTLAAWLPARKAVRIDPREALRAE